MIIFSASDLILAGDGRAGGLGVTEEIFNDRGEYFFEIILVVSSDFGAFFGSGMSWKKKSAKIEISENSKKDSFGGGEKLSETSRAASNGDFFSISNTGSPTEELFSSGVSVDFSGDEEVPESSDKVDSASFSIGKFSGGGEMSSDFLLQNHKPNAKNKNKRINFLIIKKR